MDQTNQADYQLEIPHLLHQNLWYISTRTVVLCFIFTSLGWDDFGDEHDINDA